uniref:Uncharacterized protein n=1 Tax=Mus musculus TaxID=10090 RepID=M9QUB2_MOUSE|nr:hypothetical protein P63-III [Mus musculus]
MFPVLCEPVTPFICPDHNSTQVDPSWQMCGLLWTLASHSCITLLNVIVYIFYGTCFKSFFLSI